MTHTKFKHFLTVLNFSLIFLEVDPMAEYILLVGQVETGLLAISSAWQVTAVDLCKVDSLGS